MFYPVSTEKMHELKIEFTMCALTRDDTNPAIWFAQLNKICHKLIDDYNLTTYEDAEVLQHIMFNTKPFIYQIILGIIKDRLAREIKRHTADPTFVITVTLDFFQEEFRQKNALSKKTSTPGENPPVLLLATPKKTLTKKFKKDCSLSEKQGHKSVYCWNLPSNAHKNPAGKVPDKALSATTKQTINCNYGHRTGHNKQQCFKKRNQSAEKDEKANVLF
jgi:hypothetical protein